jgi:hypothetical protein
MCMCELKPSNLMPDIRAAAPRLRLEFLDGRRSLAALYVVLLHAYQIAPFDALISPGDMAGMTQAIDCLLSEPALTTEVYHYVSRQ